jgi:hypothetical protein
MAETASGFRPPHLTDSHQNEVQSESQVQVDSEVFVIPSGHSDHNDIELLRGECELRIHG